MRDHANSTLAKMFSGVHPTHRGLCTCSLSAAWQVQVINTSYGVYKASKSEHIDGAMSIYCQSIAFCFPKLGITTKRSTEVTLGFNRTPPEHTVRGLSHKAGPKNTPACGVSGAAGSTVAWTSLSVSFFGMLWDNVWDMR
jgi:hypothetical protein